MMKARWIFIFALLFVLPVVFAADITMSQNIPQGETVIAKVSGNFLDPIYKSNIKFYRGYVQTSFDYNVGKIGNYYYIYFKTLNKPQNNYSLVISGVRYYVSSQISHEDIVKNFSINSGIADFSLTPGFIVTNGNFSFTVQNLQPSEITINIDTEINSGSTSGIFDFIFRNKKVETKSVNLLSGETQDIDINLQGINETTIRTITLFSTNTEYNIPTYVIIENYPVENTTQNETNETIPSDNETIPTDNETTPTQNETIPSDNETIPTDNETTPTENTTQVENQTEDGGSFWDLFKKENKTSDNTNSDSGVDVVVGKDGNVSLVNKNGDVVEKDVSLKTCDQLKGNVCKVNEETCDGTNVNALDSQCCIGTCVKNKENKNSKIVGWVIIGLIVILLIWFKSKYNKTKRRKFNLPGIDKKR